MDEVCFLQAGNSWPKKHTLIIGVSSDKQNIMLSCFFIIAFMNIDEDDSDEVESKQHPLEGHVS
jgi:hypothetical protein